MTLAKVNNILQECQQFKEILTFHFKFSEEMIICADCEKSFCLHVSEPGEILHFQLLLAVTAAKHN